MKLDHVVVFIDGACALCSHGAIFLSRRDRDGSLRFAPLQSELARGVLPPALTARIATLVVWDGETCFERSDAILELVRHLRAPWRWAQVMRLIPKGIRDEIYDSIATQRHQWFEGSACPVLPPAMAAGSARIIKEVGVAKGEVPHEAPAKPVITTEDAPGPRE